MTQRCTEEILDFPLRRCLHHERGVSFGQVFLTVFSRGGGSDLLGFEFTLVPASPLVPAGEQQFLEVKSCDSAASPCLQAGAVEAGARVRECGAQSRDLGEGRLQQTFPYQNSPDLCRAGAG